MRQAAPLIGLAAGGLMVLVMFGVYQASPSTFLSPVFQWSLGIFYLVAMLLAAASRPAFDRWTATRRAFLAFAAVSACFYVYYFLLLRYFDPALVDLQSELMIENARLYGLTKPGASAEQPETLYAADRLRPTFGGSFYSYVQGLLFGGAISFLMGYAFGQGQQASPSDTAT